VVTPVLESTLADEEHKFRYQQDASEFNRRVVIVTRDHHGHPNSGGHDVEAQRPLTGIQRTHS